MICCVFICLLSVPLNQFDVIHVLRCVLLVQSMSDNAGTRSELYKWLKDTCCQIMRGKNVLFMLLIPLLTYSVPHRRDEYL